MPKISAILHVTNHEPHLAQALESLRLCDEVIVVDHSCREDDLNAVREHSARIVKGVIGVDHGAYAQDARHDWILCLFPSEAITEELAASLQQWKQLDPKEDSIGYNIRIREQNGAQSTALAQELRLANRTKINWTGDCPPNTPDAPVLTGYIDRFRDEG